MKSYPVMPAMFVVALSLSVSGPTAHGVPSNFVDAAELYHEYCSVCHGDKGDGQSRARGGLSHPPRDFTQPGLRDLLTREHIVDTILNGRPGTAMVGWKTRLSEAQAASIADFIRARLMQSESPARPVDLAPTAPGAEEGALADFRAVALPDGLTGDVQLGKTFYNENCSTCHGVTGGGDGPRAYFIFPKPRNFLAQTSRARLNRSVLFHAIKNGVKGREMPAWGKVLNDQQIANVAEYVFQQMILGGDDETSPEGS